jgi:hypothetical protein
MTAHTARARTDVPSGTVAVPFNTTLEGTR